MIEWLRRISVDGKIRLLFLLPFLLLICASSMLVWQLYQESFEGRKTATREAVEAELAIVDWAHSLEASGEVSRDKAQQMALQALQRARYNGSEYFWVNSMDLKMLMHPVRPELDGQDLSAQRDPDGTQIFVRMVDIVRQRQSGFLEYRWPKPGHSEPVPKISYVTGFAPWGWVIGSGVYLDDLNAAFLRNMGTLAGGLLAALAGCFYIGHLVSRIVTRGIDKAVRVADAIADGDLTQAIRVKGGDEVAHLLTAMDRMSTRLSDTMREVRQAADSLAQASEEISAGSMDLSGRTEEAAANLQQTAASMDHLHASVCRSADSARDADQVAEAASGVAKRGGAVVSEVVSTMDGIHHASRRIGDIIGVIDGIAFQTNILALNAAVEAARAGEQGRGFAVVAGEVRTLAQRSAEAAREIKGLINASMEQVECGTEQVKSAGATMHEIVGSVDRVTLIVRDVTRASGEQKEGLDQINIAVGQLDQMTQQNAALVEESAAAAASLYDQARTLSGAVARFKVASRA